MAWRKHIVLDEPKCVIGQPAAHYSTPMLMMCPCLRGTSPRLRATVLGTDLAPKKRNHLE